MPDLEELIASLEKLKTETLEEIKNIKEGLYDNYTAAMALLDNFEKILKGQD